MRDLKTFHNRCAVTGLALISLLVVGGITCYFCPTVFAIARLFGKKLIGIAATTLSAGIGYTVVPSNQKNVEISDENAMFQHL